DASLPHRVHAAAERARLLFDVLIYILIQLVDRDLAFAMRVGGPAQSLDQVVRKDAVPERRALERHFVRRARRDDESSFGSEVLQELVGEHRAGLIGRMVERPTAGGAAVAAVEEADDLARVEP